MTSFTMISEIKTNFLVRSGKVYLTIQSSLELEGPFGDSLWVFRTDTEIRTRNKCHFGYPKIVLLKILFSFKFLFSIVVIPFIYAEEIFLK